MPGQQEVLDAYVLALRQLHERAEYEQGTPTECENGRMLPLWQPGEVIKNRIRIEAGHTVGKTKLASGIVSHFFDCFLPSIVYAFAPGYDQINDLLFKEIRADRNGKDLPGRVLETPEIKRSGNHFVKGRAASNNHGRGTERIQGQHGKYLLFILDEAEGIEDWVWNAVESMTSGGICIVLMLANPRTRSSQFHKQKDLSNTQNFRMSCLGHPNVVQGKEIIPGAVRRDYVLTMLEKHCEVIEEHSEDDHTFCVPFPAVIGGVTHPSETIYKPNAEFLFRVLGIAPANITDNTLIPVGRYEAARKRTSADTQASHARCGVDVARYGKDAGTLYIQHGKRIWRAAQFWKQDTWDYTQAIKRECLRLQAAGVTDIEIRVDGGGGFGSGIIDNLLHDVSLAGQFVRFEVREVHFNGTPHDTEAYADLITEMYAEAAESLKSLCIKNAPDALEADLCERRYKWVNYRGVAVKRLEPKDDFRKPERAGRSPDDGDGFVLAAAPDHIFKGWEWDAT